MCEHCVRVRAAIVKLRILEGCHNQRQRASLQEVGTVVWCDCKVGDRPHALRLQLRLERLLRERDLSMRSEASAKLQDDMRHPETSCGGSSRARERAALTWTYEWFHAVALKQQPLVVRRDEQVGDRARGEPISFTKARQLQPASEAVGRLVAQVPRPGGVKMATGGRVG